MLNQPLYDSLKELYGAVSVGSEGQEGGITKLGRFDDGKPVARYAGGESYHVNCPVCGDRRHRLYISHWAFRSIKKGSQGLYVDGLMLCHNERCDLTEVRKTLTEAVRKHGGRPTGKALGNGLRYMGTPHDVPLPGEWVPVNGHDANKQCVEYLESRGFDLEELWDKWRVCTVDRLEGTSWGHPRIIYPVYNNGICCFWQARVPFEPATKEIPKYVTMPGAAKSMFLYNKDLAMSSKVVVVCEGVTDVHRIGTDGEIGAVCLFGKKPSMAQMGIIRDTPMRESDGVLMLDDDVSTEELSSILDEFGGDKVFRSGMYLARLPEGMDPGGMPREDLHTVVAEAITRGPVSPGDLGG
jgi:hypothetical protein